MDHSRLNHRRMLTIQMGRNRLANQDHQKDSKIPRAGKTGYQIQIQEEVDPAMDGKILKDGSGAQREKEGEHMVVRIGTYNYLMEDM